MILSLLKAEMETRTVMMIITKVKVITGFYKGSNLRNTAFIAGRIYSSMVIFFITLNSAGPV
jgi:hypothetical protein